MLFKCGATEEEQEQVEKKRKSIKKFARN